MNAKKFYLNLRAELVELVGRIKDSNGGWLGWDNSVPNNVTRIYLDNLLSKYSERATSEFGIFAAVRYPHYLCGDYNEGEPMYITQFVNGQIIDETNGEYIWLQNYWGEFPAQPCPFSKRKIVDENTATVGFVVAKDDYDEDKEEVARVLGIIHTAKSRARDNSPRAGIREQLLLAILRLNDEILPIKLEKQIEEIAKGIT